MSPLCRGVVPGKSIIISTIIRQPVCLVEQFRGSAATLKSRRVSWRRNVAPWDSHFRVQRGVSVCAVAAEAAGGSVENRRSLAETPNVAFLDDAGKPTQFPASSGVYAVYDKTGTLQYMGLSRRLNASLDVHAAELPELCASVKCMVVPAPDKDALVAAWKQWMEEHMAAAGAPPPGNESGNTTWTKRQPRRTKPEIKLTPGRHVQLTVPLTKLIEQVVKENRVVAFIKGSRVSPQCGFSHRVLSILNESKAEYEVLDVLDEDHNPGLREAIKQFSQWPTIPQVYIGGEFLGGADIMEEMWQSGQLTKLLSP